MAASVPRRSLRLNHSDRSTPLTYNNRLSTDLEELANYHIFQWATFYRDTLSQYFDAFLLEVIESGDRPDQWPNLMKAGLSHHACEIFTRGVQYQTGHNRATDNSAITKSLTGLQMFLDLPLEFYSARLADAQHSGTGLQVRRLASAMVSGILVGYAQTQFDFPGSKVPPRFPGSWVHVLPFLTADDIREVTSEKRAGRPSGWHPPVSAPIRANRRRSGDQGPSHITLASALPSITWKAGGWRFSCSLRRTLPSLVG